MSKTDNVARFSLIFVRKVHFLENSSVRENFYQKQAETSPEFLSKTGGNLSRAPASALELARRGHVVVRRLHVVKALHCRRRAGPVRKHRLVVRVAALLTRPGLQAVDIAAKTVAMLGGRNFSLS